MVRAVYGMAAAHMVLPLVRAAPISAVLPQDAWQRALADRSTLTLLLILGGATLLFYYASSFRRRPQNTNAVDSPTEVPKTILRPERTLCTQLPSHVAVPAAAVAENGTNLLGGDGVVAWKFLNAAAVNAKDEDDARRDRALLLARLWTSSTPPKKGSTLVISIPMDSVNCAYQRYGLFLLATYYNVFLILVQDAAPDLKLQEQRRQDAMAILRGDAPDRPNSSIQGRSSSKCMDALSLDALPTHRILSSTTVAGRVALGRQLQAVAVLDYDPEVQSLLSRFGHAVILYPAAASSNHQGSDTAPSSEFGALLL